MVIWTHFLLLKTTALHHHYQPVANSDKVLLHCLELEEKQLLHAPNVDAIFLDGAAVVQMLNPGGAKTFQEYSGVVFTPNLLS